MYKKISHSETETKQIGTILSSKLNIGDIIILNGDLGSGKTKLTEGILKHFNIENQISSPTFTIVNEYNANNINIFHFDVYRLEDSEEFLNIGGDEYFYKGICIIEWGEKISDVLPKEFLKISFEKDLNDDNIRILNFIPYGLKYEKLLGDVFNENISNF